jgi:hypothetical protein
MGCSVAYVLRLVTEAYLFKPLAVVKGLARGLAEYEVYTVEVAHTLQKPNEAHGLYLRASQMPSLSRPDPKVFTNDAVRREYDRIPGYPVVPTDFFGL